MPSFYPLQHWIPSLGLPVVLVVSSGEISWAIKRSSIEAHLQRSEDNASVIANYI